MIWRWVIFSSGILCLAQAGPSMAAEVGGQVELTNSREAAIKRGKDYSGVVLWLEPLGRPGPSAPPKRVEMAQSNKSFKPHVLAIPVGGTVDFPNFDPFFHNAFSNFSGQPFDVGLYAPGKSRSVAFTHPGIVRVFCNIHPTMSAIIAVVPSPWYAVTLETGKFSIPGVPPGEYRLRIFYERALPENLSFVERAISVPESGLTLPLISITETGYIPAPHMDKHGREYPEQPRYGKYGGGTD